MWTRFAERLRCPRCRGALELLPLEARSYRPTIEQERRAEGLGIDPASIGHGVDAGLLLCASCRCWYPVLDGLPVLLLHDASVHDELRARHRSAVDGLGSGWGPPRVPPPVGEGAVQRSFSREWRDYEYDGVLWTWSYEQREAFFLAELGELSATPQSFVEIGCGLGVVTSFAARHLGGDAVGVDLSLAALQATRHFRDEPFLHFVQASVWFLPFADGSFDQVYSHGVLHHTASTEDAFRAVARLCRPGGQTSIWIYGPEGTSETFTRRLAYSAERIVRPVLARTPSALASIALGPVAYGYMAANWLQRRLGRDRQAYDFRRALHAARDRFTPLYAFRTSPEEVRRWFDEAGFEDIRRLTTADVPRGSAESARRAVGMRGRRRA